MMTSRKAGKIARLVEEWFRSNARADLPWRPGYEPYHVWVSEFMAQQTRMEVVVEYFPRFVGRFPSIAALAAAEEADVVTAWSGLGYYRRARMLHRSAREIVERFGGQLPDNVETLRSLHGFGPYSAGAVASIAFEKRVPLADGNVTRLVARLEKVDAPWRSRELEKRAWQVAEMLVEACESPRVLNQGLMELGARICRPRNPDCDACPLARDCVARADAVVGDYPRPAPKRKIVALEVPVWIITDRRGRLLFRRASGKLMRGMFQLPVGSGEPFGDHMVIEEPGRRIAELTHTITHRRIRFQLFTPELPDSLAETDGEWKWIAPECLGDHPHPSWVRKAIEAWTRSR
jgi:A/G-specific adenine glycosylase